MVEKKQVIDSIVKTIKQWQSDQGVKIVTAPKKLKEMAEKVMKDLEDGKLVGPPLNNARAYQKDGQTKILLVWGEEVKK